MNLTVYLVLFELTQWLLTDSECDNDERVNDNVNCRYLHRARIDPYMYIISYVYSSYDVYIYTRCRRDLSRIIGSEMINEERCSKLV